MRVIVLHLPNEPDVPSATLNKRKRDASTREFMSEALAPIQTLLQTRGARGTQAVSFLHGDPQIPLLSIRPCTINVLAPLGWVLSKQVRDDMSTQLKACGTLGDNCAAPRLNWVKAILNGAPNAPYVSKFDASPACAAPPPHASASR